MSSDTIVINSRDIDYTGLVGRKVSIVTEQFPGKMLSAKVLAITNNALVIDRSGSSGLVNQLVARQNLEVRFDYKGEPVVFTSTVSSPQEGRLQLPIAPDVRPLVRRRFVRFDLEKDIRLTYFDDKHIKTARLNKLKWLETFTANIGGGGLLAVMPTILDNDNYLIINLGFDDLDIPHLMLGRVCHCQKDESKKFLVGVEFVTREYHKEVLPSSLTRNLPPGVFMFDNKARIKLAQYLAKKYGNKISERE
jgi:c-di-GMP-binding flagellar brake protein YcgR